MAYRPTDVKALRLRTPQRNRRAINAKLERIAPERATQERHLGSLDEAKHHEALHRGIGGIDRVDADAVAGF